MTELWVLYDADKRIEGFSTYTLNAYALQLKMLIGGIGDLEIEAITLDLLKAYLSKQSDRLKPSSLVASKVCLLHFQTLLWGQVPLELCQ